MIRIISGKTIATSHNPTPVIHKEPMRIMDPDAFDTKMKKTTLSLACLLLLLCACSPEPGEQAAINLVPETINPTPDYWCTWGAQNFAADTSSLLNSLSLGGHSVTANYVTENWVFGPEGWSEALPALLRQDLICLFDVGWDVREGEPFDDARWKLGSLEVAEDKFPSCNGTRQDKLTRLNELVRSHGWKGTGLWLPSQAYNKKEPGRALTEDETMIFFQQAVEECGEAGIAYWKIDYGARGGDVAFRSLITDMAEEHAPGLLVEHGRGSGPLNDEECPWDTENYHQTGSYRNWDDGKALQTAVDIARVSHVLRTYDITQQLSIPTTLDRVTQVLLELSGSDAEVIVNCEDEPYIAAVLGCAMGIMRHPYMIYREGYDYDPFRFKYRIDEVLRAVRWHRIAPAWGAGESAMKVDSHRLEDTWRFQPGEAWATWVTGREVMQGAHARVARGMDLPEVILEGEPPYVICSRHPNGAVAVVSMPRVSSPRQIYSPLAQVSIRMEDPFVPIGIFGHFQSLRINFDQRVPVNGLQIMGQDLVSDRAVDISSQVQIKHDHLLIPGEVISRIGLLAAGQGDLSEPGMVLQIIKTGSKQ
jgi:hypothetical protein